MTAHMSGLINDMDKVAKTVWLVIVVDCQGIYLCHRQDKQVLEGCLCSQEGQTAVK